MFINEKNKIMHIKHINSIETDQFLSNGKAHRLRWKHFTEYIYDQLCQLGNLSIALVCLFHLIQF